MPRDRTDDVLAAATGDCSDAILAGAHGVAEREDRIADLEAAARVTTHAVDHGPGEPVAVADGRQDVTPHRGVGTAAVVDDHDLARTDIVDVVANGPASRSDGEHAHRERRPEQPEVSREGHDPQALSRDAESVERVGKRRRVVRAEAYAHSFPFGASGLSIVS